MSAKGSHTAITKAWRSRASRSRADITEIRQGSVVILATLGAPARPAARRLLRRREVAERQAAGAADALDREAQILHKTIDEGDLGAILHGGVHYPVGHVAAG